MKMVLESLWYLQYDELSDKQEDPLSFTDYIPNYGVEKMKPMSELQYLVVFIIVLLFS